MERDSLPVVFLLLGLLLTACSASPAATPGASMTAPASPVPQPTAAALPAATPTVGIPVTGPATVQVANVGNFGAALVDGEGRSLYLYTGGQYHPATPCVGEECLEDWPPLLTVGAPIAGPGLDPGKLGTIPLGDGTTQVTYNGWPLYYFNQDLIPGEARGQGDDQEWFLVLSSGEPLKSVETE